MSHSEENNKIIQDLVDKGFFGDSIVDGDIPVDSTGMKKKKFIDPLDYPGQALEMITLQVPDSIKEEKEVKREYSRLKKKYEGMNYLIITDIEDVETIFNPGSEIKDKFNTGRVIFAVWKYSSVLILTESLKEKLEYINKLGEGERLVILDKAVKNRFFLSHYIGILTGRHKTIVISSNMGKIPVIKSTDGKVAWTAIIKEDRSGKKIHTKNKPAFKNPELMNLNLTTINFFAKL